MKVHIYFVLVALLGLTGSLVLAQQPGPQKAPPQQKQLSPEEQRKREEMLRRHMEGLNKMDPGRQPPAPPVPKPSK